MDAFLHNYIADNTLVKGLAQTDVLGSLGVDACSLTKQFITKFYKS